MRTAKRFLATLLCLAALGAALPVAAQPIASPARRVVRFPSAPAACIVGDVYYDTTANVLYVCDVANAWHAVVLSGSSTGWPLLAPNGTAAAPSYSFTLDPTVGIYRTTDGSTAVNIGVNGKSIRVGASTIVATGLADGTKSFFGPNLSILDNGGSTSMTNAGGGGITFDTATGGAFNFINAGNQAVLAVDAANTLAQRNGVNAQVLRVYNTFTDASNYERLELGANPNGLGANTFGLINHSAGSGTVRSMYVGNGDAANFYLVANNAAQYKVSTAPLAGVNAAQGLLTAGTLTAVTTAELRTVTHRYDWTNAMVTALGAVGTGNIAVATLPAKTTIIDVKIVILTPDTSANALTVSAGITAAAYIDLVTAGDAKAAANTIYGNTSGTRGANNVGYFMPSVTGTTVVNLQFVKTTTNLSTVLGSTGYVLITTRLDP